MGRIRDLKFQSSDFKVQISKFRAQSCSRFGLLTARSFRVILCLSVASCSKAGWQPRMDSDCTDGCWANRLTAETPVFNNQPGNAFELFCVVRYQRKRKHYRMRSDHGIKRANRLANSFQFCSNFSINCGAFGIKIDDGQGC